MSHGRSIIHSVDVTSSRNDGGANQRHYDASRVRMTSSDSHRNSNLFRPSMSVDPPLYDATRRGSGNDRLSIPAEQVRRTSPNQNGSQSRARRSIDLNRGRIRLSDVPSQGQRRRQGSLPVYYTSTPELEAHERRTRRTEIFSVSSPNSRSTARSLSEDWDDGLRDDKYVVPTLPTSAAVLCCILNFLVPGLGTMLASVSIFCCGHTDDMSCGDKCGSCGTMFCIGVFQLLLVACFLIGWIWSCIWGVAFIANSANYVSSDEMYDPRLAEYESRHRERNNTGRHELPAPEVVVDQPYPGINYDDIRREQERRRQRRVEAQRRSRSRISLTSSNLIYPMRAPSNIAYNSPPPAYRETAETPAHWSEQNRRSSRTHEGENGYRHQTQNQETIYEEQYR